MCVYNYMILCTYYIHTLLYNMYIFKTYIDQWRFRLDFDTALLTSLPSALQKDPASRGTFDNVVVTNVEDELQKRPTLGPRCPIKWMGKNVD